MSGNGMIRVAAYARASTDEQAYSTPGQLAELRRELPGRGREIVAEIEDIGEKRHDLARPGLDRLRDLAEAGEIQEIWAWEHSRFGQFPVPEILKLELAEYGVELRSLDDAGPGEDGEDLAVIKSLFSRREQRDRVRRSQRGRKDKARRGEVFGGNRPRYGFRRLMGQNQAGRPTTVGYAVDPSTMPNVVRIFAEIANGRSIKHVKNTLEEERVPNPSGGPRWSNATLRNMILNDSYRPYTVQELAAAGVSAEVIARLDPEQEHGIHWANRMVSKPGKGKKHRKIVQSPRDRWIPVPLPLIGSGLDRNVVDRARARVAENKSTSRTADREWPLDSGILRCACCGRNMIPYPRRYKDGRTANYYYRCRPASKVLDKCPNRKSHPAAALEHEAASLFEEHASRSALLKLFDRAVAEREGREGIERILKRREHIATAIAELDRDRAGFLRQNARDVITDAELDGFLGEIAEQREALEREAAGLRDAAEEARRLAAARQSLVEWETDPEQVQPGEFLTVGASPEEVRDAYLKTGARFTVDERGELCLFLDLQLKAGAVAKGSSMSRL
jgi:DNA invertase Pin-like site-specific DNA recombinase